MTVVGLLSIPFAYFVLVVATLAWLARRRPRPRNALLLVASYAFYSTWQVRVTGWLLALSVVDWAAGEALARMRSPGGRRALATAAVAVNVALLAALKLYDFFRESIAGLAAAVGLPGPIAGAGALGATKPA